MSEPILIAYPVPAGAPQNADFEVVANGRPLGVFANGPHNFAAFSFDRGPVAIRITCSAPITGVQIRPHAAGIVPRVEGRDIAFVLDAPQKLSIEIQRGPNLFLFADLPEAPPPDPRAPNVVFYGPGYWDLKGETLSLRSGQTLYLAGGAYLDNGRALLIDQAENVTVRGRGILVAPTRVYRSRRVVFEGITIAPNYRTWMNKIDLSQHVTYQNVKVLAGDDTVVNYDGFDVMSGCHDIAIDDAFVRANDDILSVKHHPHSPDYLASKSGIDRVTFSNSVVWNLKGGSICRIGPESIGPYINRIAMKNIDIIHNQAGAVFEIRTVDGARIENILFEKIRIEEDHRPLIRFDMKNWYKVGDQQGHVQGVYLRDISVANGAGECVLEGADEAHGYRDVHFWNVRIDGELMRDPGPLGTVPLFVENLTFDRDLRPPPDDAPPRLLSVHAHPTSSMGETAVFFLLLSKPISSTKALDVECYRITGGGRILSADITPGFRQITLTVAGMRAGKDITLELAGLCDLAGNALPPAPPIHVAFRQAWQASEDFSGWQGERGWYYEQYNPAEVLVYATRKDITRVPGYWLMNAHTTPDGLRWFAHRSDAWISQDAQKPGETYFPVRTWRAPVSGIVRIEGCTGTASASSQLRILHNARATPDPQDDQTLWSGTALPASHIETTVTAGALLRFAVSGTAPYAPVSWNPTIHYV